MNEHDTDAIRTLASLAENFGVDGNYIGQAEALRLLKQVITQTTPKETSAFYKNPECTINHPGSSCNVACGE